MKELFSIFDQDSDETLDFVEVATAIYKLQGDMDKSSFQAMHFFLVLDKDDRRRLDYEQFVRLLLNVFAGYGVNFFKAAETLIEGMKKADDIGLWDLSTLKISENVYNSHRDMAKDGESDIFEVMNILQYAKLHDLFNLYDTSGDGMITLEELLLACRKFHKATRGIDIYSTINETTTTMLFYDEDKNQKLDKNEFALCVVRFAKVSYTDLPDMIDFLANTIFLEENSPEEEEYMKFVVDFESKKIKSIQQLAENGSKSDLPTAHGYVMKGKEYDGDIYRKNFGTIESPELFA